MENLNDVIIGWQTEKKFKEIDLSTVQVLKCEILNTNRSDRLFLHSIDEKQLYTATDWCVFGKTYRCRDKKCPARIVLLPSTKVIRLQNAAPHNHIGDCQQEVKNLKALNAMKKKCRDLQTIAGGKRLTKVKDIFTDVMIE